MRFSLDFSLWALRLFAVVDNSSKDTFNKKPVGIRRAFFVVHGLIAGSIDGCEAECVFMVLPMTQRTPPSEQPSSLCELRWSRAQTPPLRW